MIPRLHHARTSDSVTPMEYTSIHMHAQSRHTLLRGDPRLLKNTYRTIKMHKPHIHVTWHEHAPEELIIHVSEYPTYSKDLRDSPLLFFFDDQDADTSLTGALLGAHVPTFCYEMKQKSARARIRSIAKRINDSIILTNGHVVNVQRDPSRGDGDSAKVICPVPVRAFSSHVDVIPTTFVNGDSYAGAQMRMG